jgi:hypothetical protein
MNTGLMTHGIDVDEREDRYATADACDIAHAEAGV